MDVKEMVKFMENLGYEVIKKEKVDIIDNLTLTVSPSF